MLQSLLNLFAPKRRDNEKMAPLILSLRPTKTVHGLVVRSRIDTNTTGWLETLAFVGTDERRLDDLDRCIVDRIDHFRSTSKLLHEKIGFEFHLASENKSEVAASVGVADCRAACVHRMTVDHREDSPSVQRKEYSNNWTGSNSSTTDAVSIDANYSELGMCASSHGNKYSKLRTLTFPGGTPYEQRLTALDCAILASVITHRAKDYSRLRYMCMWFATVFFLAAKRICEHRGYPPITTNLKFFSYAGKYGKAPIIDPESGRPLFGAGNGRTLAAVKKTMGKGMLANGVPPDEVEEFLKMLDSDSAMWARDQKEGGADPIQEIVILFEARRQQIREDMVKDIHAAWQERTAAEREVQARLRAAEDRAREEQARRITAVRAAEDRVREEQIRRIAAVREAEERAQEEQERRIAEVHEAEERAREAEVRVLAAEQRAQAAVLAAEERVRVVEESVQALHTAQQKRITAEQEA